MTARSLMTVNTAIRTAYGLGAMFAPDALAKAAGVDPPDDDGRYLNRLFGGRDLTVSALVLAALNDGKESEAWAIIASCEATDLLNLLIEAKRRGTLDAALRTGLIFNATGWLVLALAARDIRG
jgi:hypothetical protein